MNFAQLGQKLYDGTISINFVGRKWLWYAISGVVFAVAIYGIVGKGLNMGIEFEGGVEYRVAVAQPDQDTVDKVDTAVRETGLDAASAPIVNTSGEDAIRIQTEPLSNDEAKVVSDAIRKASGASADDISQNVIGPSWGQQVAKKAQTGLIVFMVLVLLLIWGYFREWKMSAAAMLAMAHDIVITVGIYALSGFEVTPTAVTGVLTIVAFSLYDTIVVFDKVRENVRDAKRTHMTYAEAANLAVNQNLVRSINTTIIALLPLGAVLYAGVVMLGTGALKDLALSLFVGTAVGILSSIFIATPLLVQLKELEPGVKAGDARARRHRSRREVDPYASVPAFTEDMPEYDEPGAFAGGRGRGPVDPVEPGDPDDPGAPRGGNRPVSGGAPGRYSAGDRAGEQRSIPLGESSSAGRPQPTRKPRSQRGKR